ncbi:MAG: outer membrane beta-barrel family protein, partial [Bacteroidota bacterium]
GADMGFLVTQVFGNGVWTTVDSLNGQQQNAGSDAWGIRSVSLVAYAGQVVKLRFLGQKASTGFTGDASIDDVTVFEPAQNDLELQAITDPQNPACSFTATEPVTIEFANVVLYQTAENQLVKGVVSESDGQFRFDEVAAGQYYVQVVMLGYADAQSEPFELNAKQTSFEVQLTLEETSHTLESVEVVAKVPLLEQKADRMVVNVAQSLTGVNGSLMDVIKKVPGMLVVNGQLSLAGNSNPTILIDGRSTQYMDIESLLKEMPGDNIERIELIHQPGAEFEASGTGPIINIIVKRNKLFGTNGAVRVGVGKATRWRANTGLSLNSRQGALNFYGGAGYSYNTYQEYLLVDRIQDNDTYLSFNDQPYLPKTYRANAGLDWYANDRHTLGFGLRGIGSNNDRSNINTTTIQYADNTRPDTELETENALERQWSYYRGNVYYTFAIDTVGQKLELDANYAYFDRTSTSLATTQNKTGDGVNFSDQRNSQPGTTKIFAVKADYTKPLGQAVKLQFGGKFSRAVLDNDLFSEIHSGNEWRANPLQSNEYDFDENISAVYSKFNFSAKGWEGTLGLRFEDSRSEGYSLTIDSTRTRNIARLFPSASIARSLTQQLAISLAYSYRIERPRYSSLNPFIIYLDPFTQESGNPILRPEFTHTAKLSLSFEKQPFFSLEYVRTNDVITLITQQNPVTKATSAFDGNIEQYDKIGGSLFFPLDFIPGISGYGGFMLSNDRYQNNNPENSLYDSRRWSFTSFLQMNFTLPGQIKTEVNGWYTNGGQDGIIVFEPMFGISFGMEKKLLNDQLSLSLSVDDLANRFFFGDLDFGNTAAKVESRWDRRIVNFSVRYRFGNQFLKRRKGRRNSAADEINRAQEKN